MTTYPVRIYFIKAKVSEPGAISQIFNRYHTPRLNIQLQNRTVILCESGVSSSGYQAQWSTSKICNLESVSNLRILLLDDNRTKIIGMTDYVLKIENLSYQSVKQEIKLKPSDDYAKLQMYVVMSFSLSCAPNFASSLNEITPIQVHNSATNLHESSNISNLHHAISSPITPPVYMNQIVPSTVQPHTNDQHIRHHITNSSNSDLQNLRNLTTSGLLMDRTQNWFEHIANEGMDSIESMFRQLSTSNFVGFRPISYEQLSEYLGPLPPNWTCHYYHEHNRYYFKNHEKKATSFTDPRLESLIPSQPPLDSRWTLSQTSPYGIPIFMNSIDQSVTYRDPRTGVILLPCSELFEIKKFPFKSKVAFFKHLCSKFLISGTTKLTIKRQNLIDSSVQAINKTPALMLHRKLFLSIQGEAGLDYGGIQRELFKDISSEILNPIYGLFQYVNAEGNFFLTINPSSTLQSDHLLYFHFFGRLIGLALFHNGFLSRGLSPIFYKLLMARPPELDDIRLVDESLFISLTFIKNNPIDDLDMNIFFVYEYQMFGEHLSSEMCEDGINVMVTDQNKEQYLKLYTQFYFYKGIEEQLDCIRLGLSEIVPITWLMYLNEKELEILVSGLEELDISDWKLNTHYRNGFSPNSQTVTHFWEIVQEMDEDRRRKLLHFCTGTSVLPVGGFANLMGSNKIQKFTIDKSENLDSYPKSQTCFNRLILPDYRNKMVLQTKLVFAIQETEGFHQE